MGAPLVGMSSLAGDFLDVFFKKCPICGEYFFFNRAGEILEGEIPSSEVSKIIMRDISAFSEVVCGECREKK